MTEQEWLQSADPLAMLEIPFGGISARKLRLFGVSCCRQNDDVFDDPREQHAIVTAEKLADGSITEAECSKAAAGLYDIRDELTEKFRLEWEVISFPLCLLAPRFAKDDASYCARTIAEFARYSALAFDGIEHELMSRQADLIRDIFGNPFRPVAFDPRWRTSDTVGLAQAIYEDKAFDRMPILADALMDAGCEDDQIIAHCRAAGPHVRGCWVVDLVLNKH